MAAEGKFMKIQPTPEVMHALELCISDRTKPVLMANERFIPYLIAGLGLAKLRDDLPMLPPGAAELLTAEARRVPEPGGQGVGSGTRRGGSR